MQSEEQRLIDGLFARLQQAGTQSTARDAEAEALIAGHIQQQPGAPYYMAQTILIQEAAIKQLSSRVEALENEATQLRESARPASGGFLAGLFGGGQKTAPQAQSASMSGGSAPIPGTRPNGFNNQNSPQGNYGAPAQAAQNAPRGGGFMSGALQTAAGVAGGVVLGNMLTSMFHSSAPEEITNIINEPAQAATDLANSAVDTGTEALNNAGIDTGGDDLVQNAAWDNNDIGNDDYAGDDFGDDDDSWM